MPASQSAVPDQSLHRDLKRLGSRYVLKNTEKREKSVMLVGNFNTGSLSNRQNKQAKLYKDTGGLTNESTGHTEPCTHHLQNACSFHMLSIERYARNQYQKYNWKISTFWKRRNP